MKDGLAFQVEIIDTWNMTITPVDGVFTTKKRDAYYFEDVEKKSITLTGRPYMALRIRLITRR